MKVKNENQLNRLIVYSILDIGTILLFIFEILPLYIFLFALAVFSYLLVVSIYYFVKTGLIIDENIQATYTLKSTYLFSKIETTMIELKDVKSINKQFLSNKGEVVLVIKYLETSLILRKMFSDRQMDKIIDYCEKTKIIKNQKQIKR